MAELYDEEGNLVEGAMTKEEVDEKIETAKGEAKSETETEKEEALNELKEEHAKKEEEFQTKITDLETEMEKMGKKDYNWQKLRKSKEELEGLLSEEREKTDKKIEEIRTEIKGSKVDSTIRKLTGDDQELFDKVKFRYKTFEGEPENDEAFRKRVDDSYFLATGEKPTSPLFAGGVRTGAGKPPPPPAGAGGEKLSEGGKEVAKKMGISDEELKKRGYI